MENKTPILLLDTIFFPGGEVKKQSRNIHFYNLLTLSLIF